MVKSVSYYSFLPDVMEVEDLYGEFLYIVENAPFTGKRKIECVGALLELADRQWHTYTKLSDTMKYQVEDVLMGCWDGFNFVFVDGVLSVCARLGLQRLYEFILGCHARDISPEVAGAIRECIVKLGKNVEDPYVDFWREEDCTRAKPE